MQGSPQKRQLELTFLEDTGSEAPRLTGKGAEPCAANRCTERPAETERLMEEVCERSNLVKAYRQVMRNQGSPGVDGMTVDALLDYLKEHWPRHREQLLSGTYRPQPVRRVEIPKPNGGMRKLGIPTVLDRLIQQAVMQVLQARWDATFSESSYGFRPGRSAHQAVRKAQHYIADGHSWMVDIDLEKFFDRVNHDLLMSRVARRVKDKRMLRLIRAFLEAGVLENGLVEATAEGTPQGGPLSPLLSNLLLDELDRELERRGHRFVRYADDCNIYVRSEKAGRRVMDSITRFLFTTLKLKVNPAKSAVAKPEWRKFLGFSFTRGPTPRLRLAPTTIQRLKDRVRERTQRSCGRSLSHVIENLRPYLTGWRSYFGICDTPSTLQSLDGWIRRRLRSLVWKQWKTGRTRFAKLRQHGVGKDLAAQTACACPNPWKASATKAMQIALPNVTFTKLGLPQLSTDHA